MADPTDPAASPAPDAPSPDTPRPDAAEATLRPIYCFADSQLLFWRPEPNGTEGSGGAQGSENAEPQPPEPFLARLRAHLPAEAPRAAYIGASNGDDPTFYSIFAAAMESLGVEQHRMILSSFPAEDREFLESADLILLAGGDPVTGWEVFERSGMRAVIEARYYAGAVLVGVSAGAVQLGWATAPDLSPLEAQDLIFTFRLVPAILGAHEEGDEWRSLRSVLDASGLSLRALGIPSGGGLVYHPDQTVEPVRTPLHELVVDGDTIRRNLLLPGDQATELATVEAPKPQPGPASAGARDHSLVSPEDSGDTNSTDGPRTGPADPADPEGEDDRGQTVH